VKQNVVSLRDPAGRTLSVPQAQAARLMSAGFTPTNPQQEVTLADGGGKLSLADLADIQAQYGAMPRLETSEATFERTAEERFGGPGGTLAGLAYGAAQLPTFGTAGKLLTMAGMEPETLAQLEQAQPTAITVGSLAGAVPATALTGGLGAGARSLGGLIAREAAIGAGFGAGSELSQAAIEERQANLGTAGAAGATVGAGFGALFGAGGRMLERRAAAKAAKELEAAGAEAAVTEARATEMAKADQARDLASRMTKAADDYNAFVTNLTDLGVKPGRLETAVASVSKRVTTLGDALAAATEDVTRLESQINPIATEMAATRRQMAKNAEQQAKERARKTEELLSKRAKRDAEAAAGRDVTSLDESISKTETSLQAIDQAGQTLGAQAAHVSEMATMLGDATLDAAVRKEAQTTVDAMASIAGQDARAAERTATENAARAMTNAEFEEAALKELGIRPTSDRAINGALIEATRIEEGDAFSFLARVMDVEAGGGGRKSVVGALLDNEAVLAKLPSRTVATMVTMVDRAAAGGAEARLIKRTGAIGGTRPELLNISKAADRARALLVNQLGEAGTAEIFRRAGNDANLLLRRAAVADANAAKAARAAFEAALPSVEAQAATPAMTAAERTAATVERVTTEQLDRTIIEAETAIREAGAQEAKIVARITKLEKAAEGTGRRAETATRKLSAERDAHERIKAVRTDAQATVDSSRALRDSMRVDRANDLWKTTQSRATLAELNERMINVRNETRLAAAKDKVRVLTERKAAAQTLAADLEAQQVTKKQLSDTIAAIEREGGVLRRGMEGRLIAPEGEQFVAAQLKKFYQTEEGRRIKALLAEAGVKEAAAESPSVLGAIVGSQALDVLFGHSLITTILGAVIGAKSGRGVGRAVATLMNGLAATGMVDKFARGAMRALPPAARAAEAKPEYKFSAEEANYFVDQVINDRDAIRATWTRMASAPEVNVANLQSARQQFDEMVDYLQRKRPPAGIMTGANANAFARSVAVVKNPELVLRFIKDGTLRQQDVEVIQRLSPEAYSRLQNVVTLLHRDQPNLMIAPLFGLTKGKKKARGYTMSVYQSQQYIGMAPTREQPMRPGSEAAAARTRPSTKSPLVENTKL
jgi:hypothetical protein